MDELIDISKVSKNGKTFKTVSLFSGCGGLDLGFIGGFKAFNEENQKSFSENSFKVIWANDIDKMAVESYKKNIGNHIVCGDISDIPNSEIPDCDIVLGGFPCQDFSIAGKQRGFQSERGNLYKQMIRVIKDKKPLAFVAENVKNIISPKMIDLERNQPVINTIIDDFTELGYNVKYRCLFAPDYGVPQKRERVFIVGIRNDLQSEFKFPKPIHSPMTSKQAIDDLWGKENDCAIFNHNQISLAKFRPPSNVGTQGNQMIPANGPSHVMRAEHHMNIQAHYRTIDPNKDIQDRSNWRRLTVREAARLQTFPDEFEFIGNKSSSYKQVGNAVPPMLGWYVAKALELTLKRSI
ncbi:MAG: DNA cytosine methyltransferase [Bacteroidales bacterium]|nr:DNA cytosine methyltransferase [Bacteroidales bacterium]